MSDETRTRVALYARVSTSEQVEGDGLARQREDLHRYAERHGWEAVAEFADEGQNGDLPLADRPEAAKLLALCARGEVDVVAVTHTSRFGRDAVETLTGERDLERARVGFVVTEQGIDTRNGGRLTLTIHAGIAEDDKRQILEKTERGKRGKARKGLWTGGPAPYGFHVEDQRLVVYLPEAEVLRTATALIVDDGCTTWDAAETLNGLGLLPRRAARWDHVNLRRTLRSPTLGGSWSYTATRQRFDREDPEPIEVEIPAILTPERHRDLLVALAVSSTGPRTANGFYLLSNGRLSGGCGAPYHGIARTAGHSRFYRCRNSKPEAHERCGDLFVSADQVEEEVWRSVVALLSDPDRMTQLASDYLDLDPATPEDDGDSLAVVERRLAALERARTTQVANMLKAGVDPKVLSDAVAELAAEERAVKAHRARLVLREEVRVAPADRAARIEELAAVAATRMNSMPPREQRAVLDVLDLHVHVEGWHGCTHCDGKGKVKGGRGGLPCPVCRAMRRVPELHVEGYLPFEANVEHLSGAAPRRRNTEVRDVGVPFSYEIAIAS